MKTKKFLSFVLAILLLPCLQVSASAENAEEDEVVAISQFSEYDLYIQLQEMTEDELLSDGYSWEEVELIKNTEFEQLLMERGKLSFAQLSNLGYTDEEIIQLKNYCEGIAPYSSIDVYALAGVCTGKIVCSKASRDAFGFGYQWSWDHCPVVTATDAMAVRWCAFGFDGDYLDVDLTDSLGVVTYYLGNQRYDIRSFSPEKSLEFRTLQCTFPVIDPLHRDAWAKQGAMSISLERDSTITRDIHHIKIAGLYGHSVINIGIPSITVSANDVGFSFSGGLNTDNIADAKIKVTWDGIVTNIAA